MKKQSLLFILFAAALLAGCTTPEQDQQIRLFWLTQYGELMAKHLGKNLPAPAALAHSMPEASQPAAVRTPRKPIEPQPQLIDVTLETDALPGNAPLADRKRMKRAWDAVQLSNQKTLEDINVAFGAQVKGKAFLITANTEKQLKQEAKQAANFAAYFARQRDLLAKQEQSLTQLMTQNRNNIKKLKKPNTAL